jgi:hypothetical protein
MLPSLSIVSGVEMPKIDAPLSRQQVVDYYQTRNAVRRPASIVTYFIQSENGGPIKIGKTKGSPYRRLKGIQTSHPEQLKLLGWIEEDCEENLHRHFSAIRIRGEWFSATTELLHYIDRHSVFTPSIYLCEEWHPVWSAMHMFGCRKGLSHNKVRKWIIDGCPSKSGGVVFLKTQLIANEFATNEAWVREFKDNALIHTCRTNGHLDRENCVACKWKGFRK